MAPTRRAYVTLRTVAELNWTGRKPPQPLTGGSNQWSWCGCRGAAADAAARRDPTRQPRSWTTRYARQIGENPLIFRRTARYRILRATMAGVAILRRLPAFSSALNTLRDGREDPPFGSCRASSRRRKQLYMSFASNNRAGKLHGRPKIRLSPSRREPSSSSSGPPAAASGNNLIHGQRLAKKVCDSSQDLPQRDAAVNVVCVPGRLYILSGDSTKLRRKSKPST